ncbi:DUF2309 family protein [Altererythrobacter oceanensis]|uniref:Probable inorganic carbon transporter subunit DabA n=2 Tax=Qipengyuania oceanensis TaxID=1463597 RepID=A0A844YFJ6_9SPHN|nr:DUF2309 family protein [Qipengyuania oceanensis]
MNMYSPLATSQTMLTRAEVASLVALAARTVPPLWPLDSAIAVNPLAGFEDRPFADAVTQAARTFGARESLPLAAWRQVYAQGRIGERELRDAAMRQLGGCYEAMANIAPGVMAIDLLMARLVQIEPACTETRASGLAPDAAFIAKWCAAYFNSNIAATPIPYRELGLYRCVLALAAHDPQFRDLAGERGTQLLLAVPRDPFEAIAEGLAERGSDEDALDHLGALVARLPGWAGHIRWRCEHADSDRVAGAPAAMADLLALWVLLERADALSSPPGRVTQGPAPEALARHFGLDTAALDAARTERLAAIAALDDDALGAIFMAAAESTYANTLLLRLEASARTSASDARPAAQLVMCIDVRSEPFRRRLERTGDYETFGYAGFFGLPMALQPFGEQGRKRLLPVLLSPRHDLVEAPAGGDEAAAGARRIAADGERDERANDLFATAKLGAASAFATAEATGPVAALSMLARTLAPTVSARAAARRARRRAETLAPVLDPCADETTGGFRLADKIGYAAALFQLTGMKARTARLVVLAGHGGSAVNNPYASALDCGACGGHAGGSNARVLAAMLNDPAVREGLAARGLEVPADSHFIAAQHDTTTDRVEIFDRCRVPDTHREELAALERDMAAAAATNRAWRAQLLSRAPGDLFAGSVHWGEVRPEWGLAGNAAFLVGPRQWSADIDLEGRAFLHSYDWTADPSGEALTTILTAPMVVAQWINCQYLFSTVDNERYGSGDKVTHNVIGGIGVVQGNGGDLKVGLPRQSLFDDEGAPFHVPQRLLTVVLAPLDRVKTVVEQNDILARLFGNGWVQLVVVDPETGKALRWRENGAASPEGTSITSLIC